MARYNYRIAGRAANGQTWLTTGSVESPTDGGFPNAMTEAQRQSFQQLTEGKAVYGSPGAGCHGPYKIDEFHLEREDR